MVKKFSQYFLFTSAIVLFLDQITKYFFIGGKTSKTFSFLKLHLITNTGAAFGLFKGMNLLLMIISVIAIVLLVYYYKEVPSDKYNQFFYGILGGGVAGNLIDRILHGHVIDFIDFGWWPAFNIADSAITVAVIGLIVLNWKK